MSTFCDTPNRSVGLIHGFKPRTLIAIVKLRCFFFAVNEVAVPSQIAWWVGFTSSLPYET